jgi:hypothetical protein
MPEPRFCRLFSAREQVKLSTWLIDRRPEIRVAIVALAIRLSAAQKETARRLPATPFPRNQLGLAIRPGAD